MSKREVNTVILSLDIYDDMNELINKHSQRIKELEKEASIAQLRYSDLVHEIRELAKARIIKSEEIGWFVSSDMAEVLALIGIDEKDMIEQVKADEELEFPWEVPGDGNS